MSSSTKVTILAILLAIAATLMSIGYSAINIPLEISGQIDADAQSGIFITEVVQVSELNASGSISDFYGTLLHSFVQLSQSDNNSNITFQVQVYNNTNDSYAFKGATYAEEYYDNTNIIFNYSINQNEVISSHSYKTFTVTFEYKNGASVNNALNSYINFEFGRSHSIEYNSIETDNTMTYNIANGLTYTHTFTWAPYDVTVTMGGATLVKNTDYTYTNGTLTIPNVTGNLVITKNSTYQVSDYVFANIESRNEYKGSISEGQTYSGIANANNSGVYSILDPNMPSQGNIYFYRGNTSYNYFSFAGKTWRILRINSDGSLRLILNTLAGTSQYKSSDVPTTRTINGAISHLAWSDSTVYSSLQTWYTNNLASYDSYILNSQYVFDTSYQNSTSSANENLSVYYFGSYLRVGADGNLYQPTYAYSVSSLISDKIGLASADEILYAGAFWQTNNTSYFLYNSQITTDWWTMSPSFWDNASHYKTGMIVMGTSGKIYDWPNRGATLTSSLGLRPVITIRGDEEITGNGTSSNPYRYVN